MFYFLDEPVEPFVKTAEGNLSTGAIISIAVSAVAVIAVAVSIILIMRKKK